MGKPEPELYYSTGEAAKELKAGKDRIVALCKTGVIKAKQTPGGHWRISRTELVEKKRTGLPPLPRPMPRASKQLPEAPDVNKIPLIEDLKSVRAYEHDMLTSESGGLWFMGRVLIMLAQLPKTQWTITMRRLKVIYEVTTGEKL